MTRAGRKPTGPALATQLDGSPRAKERLEAILETIASSATIDEASSRLGIKAAMFYRLRTEVLQAGLARLEPRPIGRPSQHPTAAEERCRELERRIEELESELKIARVQEEIARVMPQRVEEPPALKKTTRCRQSLCCRRRRGQRKNPRLPQR
jgi:hypothetical protein